MYPRKFFQVSTEPIFTSKTIFVQISGTWLNFKMNPIVSNGATVINIGGLTKLYLYVAIIACILSIIISISIIQFIISKNIISSAENKIRLSLSVSLESVKWARATVCIK